MSRTLSRVVARAALDRTTGRRHARPVRVVGRAIRWLYGKALLVGSLGLALLLVVGFGGCVAYGGIYTVQAFRSDDGASAKCAPGYSQCLDPGATDFDCSGGSGDGPRYVYGSIRVTGSDPFDLDRDGDGVACE